MEREFVESRREWKRECENLELAGHIDQFLDTSAQHNPQGVPELPLCLVDCNELQCH